MATDDFLAEILSDGPAPRGPSRHEARRRRGVGPSDSPGGGVLLLLIDPEKPHRLVAYANRGWVRLLARLFGPSLDRRLAQGRPPESNVLLAARAHTLVSPAHRRALAQDLAHVVALARTPPVIRSPRAPLNRRFVLSRMADLEEICKTLLAARPLSARGVAMVGQLLADGAGPLYSRLLPAGSGNALAEAIAELH